MNLHDEIAKVAAELYEKSGRIEGRSVENWLEAEKIVLTCQASKEIEEPDETPIGGKMEVKPAVIAEETGASAETEEMIQPATYERAERVSKKRKKSMQKVKTT